MPIKIQIRRDLSTHWSSFNPILSQGEIAVELDTFQLKIGDGNLHWNDLPYASGSQIHNLADLSDIDITNLVNGSLLVYSSSTNKWTATTTIDSGNIDGGHF